MKIGLPNSSTQKLKEELCWINIIIVILLMEAIYSIIYLK